MRKVLFTLLLCLVCAVSNAQEYTVRSAGQGKSGNYLVQIVVSTKGKLKGASEDLVMRYAVHGVLFRGLMAADGYGEQKPLIKDANVENTKAEFFKAFWNEGKYKQYATIVQSSLSVMKNKKTKMTETAATVIVDKETLQHVMEENGIIQGFSNLW